jgi:hypothetical protein
MLETIRRRRIKQTYQTGMRMESEYTWNNNSKVCSKNTPKLLSTHHEVHCASTSPAGPQQAGHSLRLAEVAAPAYHSRRPFLLALNVHFASPHDRTNSSSPFTSSNVIPQISVRVLSVPLNPQLRSITPSSCAATFAVFSNGLSKIFSGLFSPFPFPFPVHGTTGRSIGAKIPTPWISERINVLFVRNTSVKGLIPSQDTSYSFANRIARSEVSLWMIVLMPVCAENVHGGQTKVVGVSVVGAR